MSSEFQEEDEEKATLLELWSDTEVSEYIALLWELMVRKPRSVDGDRVGQGLKHACSELLDTCCTLAPTSIGTAVY